MSEDTLTRVGLTQAVLNRMGISRKLASSLVDQVFEELAAALARGDSVRIRNFGRFDLHHKGERIGRNPNTQVEAIIKPRRVVSFRSANRLKQRMNPSLQEQ